MPMDAFLAKLKRGEIATTIAHGDGESAIVIEVNPFRIIGRVVSQEALDDVVVEEFEAAGDGE